MFFTRFVCLFVQKHKWDAVGGGGHPALGEQRDVDGLGGGVSGEQLGEDAGLPLDWFLKHFTVG